MESQHLRTLPSWNLMLQVSPESKVFATKSVSGVSGTSDSGPGVVGKSTAGSGVFGVSKSGIGVHGKGGQFAGKFEGAVTVEGPVTVAGSLTVQGNDLIAVVIQGLIDRLEASGPSREGVLTRSPQTRPIITGVEPYREAGVTIFTITGSGFRALPVWSVLNLTTGQPVDVFTAQQSIGMELCTTGWKSPAGRTTA